MILLGDALRPWVFGIMTSILWIHVGLSWRWVLLAWSVCSLLNQLHKKGHKKKAARLKKMIDEAKKNRDKNKDKTGK